jgi:hypothetical protein
MSTQSLDTSIRSLETSQHFASNLSAIYLISRRTSRIALLTLIRQYTPVILVLALCLPLQALRLPYLSLRPADPVAVWPSFSLDVPLDRPSA